MSITYAKYQEAKKTIAQYEEQLKKAVVKITDLKIDQKVKRDYPESFDYWVSEIEGDDVLIRTTEDHNHPEHDDFLVNISEIRLTE